MKSLKSYDLRNRGENLPAWQEIFQISQAEQAGKFAEMSLLYDQLLKYNDFVLHHRASASENDAT